MKYYLLTVEEFNANHADCGHAPAYSLNGAQCIIEIEDTEVVTNYVMAFETSGDVNAYRYSATEAANWIDENDI